MLRGWREQPGAGAVCALPVAAPVTDNEITSGRNHDRAEDEQQKQQHGFLHEGSSEWQGSGATTHI